MNTEQIIINSLHGTKTLLFLIAFEIAYARFGWNGWAITLLIMTVIHSMCGFATRGEPKGNR